MAGMHIERYIAREDSDEIDYYEETVWFKYETDAWSQLQTMIDLHISLEGRVPFTNGNGQTGLSYGDGSTILINILSDYDKREW